MTDKNKDVELLPCPFCSSTNIKKYNQGDTVCLNCLASVENEYWNTRHLVPLDEKEVAEALGESQPETMVGRIDWHYFARVVCAKFGHHPVSREHQCNHDWAWSNNMGMYFCTKCSAQSYVGKEFAHGASDAVEATSGKKDISLKEVTAYECGYEAGKKAVSREAIEQVIRYSAFTGGLNLSGENYIIVFPSRLSHAIYALINGEKQ